MSETDRPTTPPLPPLPVVGLPPPPLATEAVLSPRDVPLPWTTPIATLLAGAIGSAGMAGVVYFVFGAHDLQPLWIGGVILWYAGLGGLAGTAADRVLPMWPAAGRWGLAAGLAGVVPNPVLILEMADTGSVEWAIVTGMGAVVGVLLALFGVALGYARRSSEGLWWKLSLTGAGAAGAMPATIVGVVVAWSVLFHGPGGLPSSAALEIAATVAAIGLLGGLVGLAVAERLHWALRARRRAMAREDG